MLWKRDGVFRKVIESTVKTQTQLHKPAFSTCVLIVKEPNKSTWMIKSLSHSNYHFKCTAV